MDGEDLDAVPTATNSPSVIRPATRADADTESGAVPIAGKTAGAGAQVPGRVPVITPPTAPWMVPPGRRSWDPGWLQDFAGKEGPLPVRFELLNGELAEGEVLNVDVDAQDGQVVVVAGTLSHPEAGSFFFRRQNLPGVAGSHIGVVQLPASGRAFRLEPSAADGSPELVSRRLGEVVCIRYTKASGSSDDNGGTSTEPEEAPFVDIGQHPTIPVPEYQNGIPVLESLPGARGVIYLDFDGETTTQWGDGSLIVARKPSLTASQIREIWRHVAADYSSFTVNLTTDLRVFERAAENSRIRVIITPTSDAAPGTGGVAFIGSWNWTGDTPCWVFLTSVKEGAEAISHEVGHTLGLGHDGRPNEEYYGGHGSGESGWAPIMGVGYGQPVTQWSKGEYANASNKEDDLRTITSGGNTSMAYRPDDHGGTAATASALEIFSGGAVTNRGVIERNTDVDTFRFATRGGPISLTARPATVSPNLAVRMQLMDASDQVLVDVAPISTLRAILTTNLPAGEYAVTVRGAGRGANATSGFTAYGSLGYYQLAGTVSEGVEPVRLTVAENAPDGTRVGDLNSMATGPGPRVFLATGGSGVGPLALSPEGALTVALSGQLNFEVREQFELWVDIQYPDDPERNEIHRRVVVRVDDVNEAPVITAPPMVIFNRTRQGTVVGAVTASDPDLYTRLRYGIGAGNESGLFGVNSYGEVVLLTDLETGPTTFRLRVDTWDTGASALTNSVEAVVTVLDTPEGMNPGSLEYARHFNIPGTSLRDLTNHVSFPRSPHVLSELLTAEVPPALTGTNYGGVMRAYFLPPVSGPYTFAIAGDDATELRLSTTDQPEAAVRIASSASATERRRWTQNTGQRSRAITLEAGRPYYLEARVKEGTGQDHLAVAWSSTAAGSPVLQVIPGRYLAPFKTKTAPRITASDLSLHRNAFPGARFGRVDASDPDGSAALTYELVSSSLSGLVSVNATNGWLRVMDSGLLASTASSSLTLRVRVSDSGGLSSTGTFAVRLIAPAALVAKEPIAEIFNNIGGGNAVNALTNQSKFPGRPDLLRPVVAATVPSLVAPSNAGNNYGTRIRGLVVAPRSGSYRFYIASDDNSELWLGTSASPSSARLVARVTGAVGPQNWTQQTGQRSAPISLVANQRYYFEARHKEGSGDDHLAVGWTPPQDTEVVPIPLARLAPVDLGQPPIVIDASGPVPSDAAQGTTVADLSATDSPLEVLTWRIAGGNDEGIFAVDPDEGTVVIANRDALQASPKLSWELQIAVQDSGYGDQYPRRESSSLLTLTRSQASTPFDLWAGANGIAGARPGDDGDGDGAINLLEFAFGGDPRIGDAASLRPRIALVSGIDSTRVHLTFRRRLDAAVAGVSYLPEVTPSLVGTGWVSAGIGDATASTEVGGLPAGYEEATVILTEAVPDGDVSRFLRVRVELPGSP